MASDEPFELICRDGHRLFARAWSPVGDARGVVSVVHGLGEHSGRYQYLAEALAGRGFAVVAADLRGHGKTAGQRGHIANYETALDDLQRLLESAAQRTSSPQRFLLGHSLGGNLVLNYVLRRQPNLTGAVALSPLILPTHQLPRSTILFARLVNILWPSFCLRSQIDPRRLSSDEDAVARYVSDPLVHCQVSVRLGVEMFAAGRWLLEHAERLQIPLLLMHGDADSLTSAAASREFAQRAGDRCTLNIWPGLQHELHWESQRDEVIEAIAAWLEQRG